jgi:hypothetical protein
MAYPTAAGVPSFSGTYVPYIFAGKLLEKFYDATVFGAIANTDYEGSISDMGDKVIIRTVPDVSINDYVRGQALTYENLNPETVELLIDQGKYYGLPIRDIDKVQSDIDFQARWAQDASEQLKIAIDRTILNSIYTSVAAKNKGDNAGRISGSLTLGKTTAAVSVSSSTILGKIIDLGQALDEQNVPETGRWLVAPAGFIARLKMSDLKDASITGDTKSPLRNGRVGMIDRFEVYLSNNMTPISDTQQCYHVLAGHNSGITFASQLVKSEVVDNPHDFGKLLRGLQVFGYKMIKPEAVADLYCYLA